jgi:hypothetical protein
MKFLIYHAKEELTKKKEKDEKARYFFWFYFLNKIAAYKEEKQS